MVNSPTLLKFLCGEADAIRVVAASPDTLFVGAIFVFSAALARTWQRQDLTAKPWLMAVPFLASIGSSAAFVLLFTPWWFEFADLLKMYPTILGLFWFTAPLAWLYGWPFERGNNRIRSIKLRMWALLLVSVWRMTLIMRVLAVLYDVPVASAITCVLVFGDLVALAALRGTHTSQPESVPRIVTMMGGVAPTGPRETRILSSVTGCLVPVCVLGLIVGLPLLYQFRPHSDLLLPAPGPSVNATADLWLTAIGAVAFWLLLLPIAQAKQRLRTETESLINSRRMTDAVRLLHQHQHRDLPNQWAPPFQRALSGENPESVLEFVLATQKLPPDSWLHAVTAQLLLDFLREPLLYWFHDERTQQVLDFLKTLELHAEDAAAVLGYLDGMKITINLFASSLHESDSSESTVEPNGSEDFSSDPDLITEWPTMTAARVQLLEILTSAAGDSYTPLEESDDAPA